MLRIAFYSLLLGLMALGCRSPKQESLPYYNSPDFSPIFIADPDSVPLLVNHIIDSFSFTDQNGRDFSRSDVAGRIHIANFFFTSCGSICPAMMENLGLVDSAYRRDSSVLILSYTVTPWRDSVSRLREYADARGIQSPQWHLLTGSRSSIYSLARRSYFAEEDLGFSRDSSEFLHTEHVLLVDGTGRIRGIYNGTLQLEMQQMVKDIALLRKE